MAQCRYHVTNWTLHSLLVRPGMCAKWHRLRNHDQHYTLTNQQYQTSIYMAKIVRVAVVEDAILAYRQRWRIV